LIEVREFFNPTITPAQFSQLVAEAGAAELKAMKVSIADRLKALAATGKLPPDVFRRPIVGLKLAALLGADDSAALVRDLEGIAQRSKAGLEQTANA